MRAILAATTCGVLAVAGLWLLTRPAEDGAVQRDAPRTALEGAGPARSVAAETAPLADGTAPSGAQHEVPSAGMPRVPDETYAATRRPESTARAPGPDVGGGPGPRPGTGPAAGGRVDPDRVVAARPTSPATRNEPDTPPSPAEIARRTALAEQAIALGLDDPILVEERARRRAPSGDPEALEDARRDVLADLATADALARRHAGEDASEKELQRLRDFAHTLLSAQDDTTR